MKNNLALINANVITLDNKRPFSDTVVVRDGRIFSLNSDDVEKDSLVIDCMGKTVLPGFIDTHMHLYSFARSSLGNDITELPEITIASILKLVKELVDNSMPGEWISIFGYNPFDIKEKRLITKAELDSVSPNNPVRLYHRSGQAQMFNSNGLKKLGITMESEDTDEGSIDREIPSGEPSGLLFGMDKLIAEYIPEEGQELMERAAFLAGQRLSSMGITTIQDMSLRNDFQRIETFDAWHRRGLIPQSIYSAAGIDAFNSDRKGFSERLPEYASIKGVKLILNQIRGSLNISKEKLTEYFTALQKSGISGMIHCVDDIQMDAAINAIESAQKAYPDITVHHRIEHASICDSVRAEKLAALGINVSSQPGFVFYSGDRYLETVNASDQQLLYAFKTVSNAGVTLAFSSDAPISPLNPFAGIYAAVTRKTKSGNVLTQSESLTLIDALKMYTVNGAKILGIDKDTGSLSVGKSADLILIDKNPLALEDMEELLDIKPEMTVIQGKIVWKR